MYFVGLSFVTNKEEIANVNGIVVKNGYLYRVALKTISNKRPDRPYPALRYSEKG